MLSVVVPMFNAAHVLPETVPAMLAQRERAEWIFVDDGSRDETRKVLDTRIEESTNAAQHIVKILSHETNKGRAAARNTGLKAATGNAIVFLDADAAPEPGFLDCLKRTVAQEGVIAAIGRLEMVSDDPEDAFVRYTKWDRRGPSAIHTHAPTPWKYFLTTASCVRREVLRHIGDFNDDISYGEDLEIAVRISRNYPDGLRYAPDANVRLHDLGSLEMALAKMREFGRDNLPAMVMDYPELAQWTGVDVVVSSPVASLRTKAIRALLRPGIAKSVRRILPYLPNRLSNYAVRYLIGYTLATSYKEGLAHRAN